MIKSLYSYLSVAVAVVSLISTSIMYYEPEPQKVSLAEYEVLMSERKEMYAEGHKIDSEANYEVTEVSEGVINDEKNITEESYTEPVSFDVVYASAGGTYLGCYELTAYMWTGDPCADGVYPSCGYTVACNDPALWHRWIYIEGYGNYYVHDVGGMPSYNIIDVYLGDYDSCVQFGRRSANVYLLE